MEIPKGETIRGRVGTVGYMGTYETPSKARAVCVGTESSEHREVGVREHLEVTPARRPGGLKSRPSLRGAAGSPPVRPAPR